MTITVLIADDQPLMRNALRTCLEAEPDITVVGETGNGVETVRLAKRLRPDVVVMDVRMPIVDGIEATRQVVALPGGPPARVLGRLAAPALAPSPDRGPGSDSRTA